MFVSDCLEELICGAEVRNVVRRDCIQLALELPDHIRYHIVPVAEYVGGKCMGYPAVWLVQRIVGLDLATTKEALQRARTTLFLSLSTSISDDFLDANQKTSAEHLMFFYLMLLDAITRASSPGSSIMEFVRSELIGTMDLFVGVNPVLIDEPDDSLKRRILQRGRRIGNFHRIIAREMVEYLDQPPERKDLIVKAAGQFGEWCAYLDDLLDVEDDIVEREFSSQPIRALLGLWPGSGLAIDRADFAALADKLVSPELILKASQYLVEKLELVADQVSLVSESFAGELRQVERLLPAEVERLRCSAHQEFLRKRFTQGFGKRELAEATEGPEQEWSESIREIQSECRCLMRSAGASSSTMEYLLARSGYQRVAFLMTPWIHDAEIRRQMTIAGGIHLLGIKLSHDAIDRETDLDREDLALCSYLIQSATSRFCVWCDPATVHSVLLAVFADFWRGQVKESRVPPSTLNEWVDNASRTTGKLLAAYAALGAAVSGIGSTNAAVLHYAAGLGTLVTIADDFVDYEQAHEEEGNFAYLMATNKISGLDAQNLVQRCWTQVLTALSQLPVIYDVAKIVDQFGSDANQKVQSMSLHRSAGTGSYKFVG